MALISMLEGFTAAARLQPQAALRHARAALTHADALAISHDYLRWAWPVAARAAHELRDTASTGELLALLAACQSGHLPPMLRAERDLTLARLAAGDHVGAGRRSMSHPAPAIPTVIRRHRLPVGRPQPSPGRGRPASHESDD